MTDPLDKISLALNEIEASLSIKDEGFLSIGEVAKEAGKDIVDFLDRNPGGKEDRENYIAGRIWRAIIKYRSIDIQKEVKTR